MVGVVAEISEAVSEETTMDTDRDLVNLGSHCEITTAGTSIHKTNNFKIIFSTKTRLIVLSKAGVILPQRQGTRLICSISLPSNLHSKYLFRTQTICRIHNSHRRLAIIVDIQITYQKTVQYLEHHRVAEPKCHSIRTKKTTLQCTGKLFCCFSWNPGHEN